MDQLMTRLTILQQQITWGVSGSAAIMAPCHQWRVWPTESNGFGCFRMVFARCCNEFDGFSWLSHAS